MIMVNMERREQLCPDTQQDVAALGMEAAGLLTIVTDGEGPTEYELTQRGEALARRLESTDVRALQLEILSDLLDEEDTPS